ncbi:MAG: hypothetical protein Q4D24_08885 [Erysipelotrichaceae bacterium]|nr:hypothetical protein [Erysipelotrichaceae bacterium]
MPGRHEKTVTLLMFVTVRSVWYECRFSGSYTLNQCYDLLQHKLLHESLTPFPALFLDHETKQYLAPDIPLSRLGIIRSRYIIVC